MEITWLFHHESWGEPWSSDDFPASESQKQIDQRIRTIKSEPWWENIDSEVVRFLHDELPYEWPWGYTVYRTVYTPESDQHWNAAIESIPKNVYARLGDLNGPNQDEKPHRLLREGYRALVFDNKAQFDGATYDQIRQHFKAFVDSDNCANGVRFRFCLVIDEGSLQSVIRNPEPQKSCSRRERDWKTKNGAWVTVIDPDYRPGESYSTRFYPGYFRLHLNDLWWLSYIGDSLELPDLCGKMRGQHDVPWFDGDF